jgi:hypothetical protein
MRASSRKAWLSRAALGTEPRCPWSRRKDSPTITDARWHTAAPRHLRKLREAMMFGGAAAEDVTRSDI